MLMPTTYTLKITQIDCLPYQNNQTDIAIKAHWAYTGTSEDNRSAGVGGTTNITYVEGESFTPYAQLTEEQVTGWVLNSWSQQELDSIRNVIESQLNIKTDILPWIKTETTEELNPPTE